jgi:sn-glycerol 3-phosphate transport system permease protein
MKGNTIRKISPYLYVAPALVLAFLFSYKPFFLAILDSLYHVSQNGKLLRFVGFDNYRILFASDSFRDSWRNTLTFTALFVPVNLVVTLFLSFACNYASKTAKVAKIVLLLPMAVAMSSAVLLFKTIFDENLGILNGLLGSHIPWFTNGTDAMWMLVFTGVWLDVGFDFLLFSSSLSNIPKDLEEVADLEGASFFQRLRYLEIPMIAPTLVFVLANNIKDAMLISAPVMILTEGGPYRSTQTLVYQMYLEGFKSGNIAIGSAIATVVFLVTFLFLLLILAFQKRRVFYQ